MRALFLQVEMSRPSDLDDDLADMRVAGKRECRSSASAAAPDVVPRRVALGCTEASSAWFRESSELAEGNAARVPR